MVSSLSFRPVSSIREQQHASPRLSSINTTPCLPSSSNIGNPSPRFGSITGACSERPADTSSSEQRLSSPPAASTRSSETSFDRHSVSSLGQRSISTVATLAFSHDIEPLPPITSLGIAKTDLVPPRIGSTKAAAFTMNPSEKADLVARRVSPPSASLRPPASPAGRISNHSAEWDIHSDRGSPRIAGRRSGPPLPAASVPYAREYASSPRDTYREAAYRDPRELSPPTASSGLKRKPSISSDIGARRAPPERVERNGSAWHTTPDYPSRAAAYAEADYYRARGRGETPERTYHSAYSRDAAYATHYADPRMEDPRYSPRHSYPTSPSTSRTTYRSGAHDTAAPGGHPYAPVSRRSDRYSPAPLPRSPSYAPRQALPPPQAPPPPHDPYSRSAPHSSYLRRPSPPSYISDTRPVLPPLSSRATAPRYPAAPAAPAHASRSSRYTPPSMDPMAHSDRLSASPEPHGYPEPFYPDRRLYFARERIQDAEMDEYYHGPLGSAGGAGGKVRYGDAYYDAYGPAPGGAYAPAGAHAGGQAGNGGGRMASPGVAPMGAHTGARHAAEARYAGAYSGGEYMQDARDMHAHAGVPRMGRAGGVMPIAAAHVPPGPAAGIAPPPRRRGKLPKPVTDLLKTWLLEHASHPYPTEDEKRSLCSMTGLTLSQVSNWFINARRRILLPAGANGSPATSTAAQVKAAFRDDSNSPEA